MIKNLKLRHRYTFILMFAQIFYLFKYINLYFNGKFGHSNTLFRIFAMLSKNYK